MRTRALIAQGVLLLLVVALGLWLAHNTASNLAERGITLGFDFLERAARFPLSQSVLPYSPVDSFAWAFVVGLGNTLFASLLVIVAATLCGIWLALARRSEHPLARGVSTVIVESVRNTPLVVQLLFWYALFTVGLPGPHDALQPLAGVYLTNRGLYLPWPEVSLAPFDITLVRPALNTFNFTGGLEITPEFAALFLGLGVYSTAFIGEIIRGGIDAVNRGQWEAGRALGLSERQTLRRVIAPQALRIMIPPLTSQYINVVKNTTLALVVGYPELALVTATAINQTGQAVEGILVLMLAFLSLSLAAAALMNWFERRFALVER